LRKQKKQRLDREALEKKTIFGSLSAWGGKNSNWVVKHLGEQKQLLGHEERPWSA
jgi:hypothetical protein